MIGNDIVDLRLASVQSNWKRSGWLQKVFTDKEQEYITTSKTPDIMVWKLWSMKEAAYKAYQRRFALSRIYNPQKIKCVDSQSVLIDTICYTTTSRVTPNFVYSEAFSEELNFISKIFEGSKKQAKVALECYLRQKYSLHSQNYVLKKDQNGIPHLYSETRQLQHHFSLTHHGVFSAFILLI